MIDKIVFSNYEIYNIEVSNYNDSPLIVDDLTNPENIYIQDENGVKYYWKSSEYLKENLTIENGFTKAISIKINKACYPASETKELVLKNVIVKNKNNVEIVIDL